MDFTTSHYIQMIAGLSVTLGYGLVCAIAPKIKMASFLLIIAPFQIIDSRYGTLNVLLVIVFSVFVLFDSKLKLRTRPYVGMLLGISAVVFMYTLSLVLVPQPILLLKFTYIIGIASAFMLFFSVYHVVRSEEDLISIAKAIIFSNLLVLVYCGILLAVGNNTFVPFGLKEFAFQANRADRLMGPFNAAEIVSEYFVLMNILIVFLVLYRKIAKLFLVIVFLNFCAIIGTGSRGGLIATVIAGILALILFWRQIKLFKLIVFVSVVTIMIFASSYLMLQYTSYNVMYERLENTTFHGITPDTRSNWSQYFESLDGAEWLYGHGARLPLPDDLQDFPTLSQYFLRQGGRIVFGYPHNLYIYLLYSVGLLGVSAYFFLYLMLLVGLLVNVRQCRHCKFLHALNLCGILLVLVFLIDQLRIEYLRHYFTDYQQILFGIFALFIASGKLGQNSLTATEVGA